LCSSRGRKSSRLHRAADRQLRWALTFSATCDDLAISLLHLAQERRLTPNEFVPAGLAAGA
jgi:hypothetical protein